VLQEADHGLFRAPPAVRRGRSLVRSIGKVFAGFQSDRDFGEEPGRLAAKSLGRSKELERIDAALPSFDHGDVRLGLAKTSRQFSLA
jgi:hypothetical protein